MDKNEFKLLLRVIINNQRNIYKDFRMQSGLNRFDVELLFFADEKAIFKLYEIQKQFSCMNIQQIRRTTKKLTDLKGLEILHRGIKNKPSIYCITDKGKGFIQVFNQLWFDV
ncbi:hypothetical protein [Mucilaginibacter sp.]|uniref:hypothetical protein n=1 Tax=Mucilaginibacter sp. TaxID=1882438 RepID=UPI002BD1C988|nr:hypothetical protein [Mucilaginibacter sp.]HTI60759.1 hypothetical protein [Mucilaginibacter sp.]